MGIGVLSILLPALSMTVPGGIMSLVPWGTNSQSLPLFTEASEGAPPPDALAPPIVDTHSHVDDSSASSQPPTDPGFPPIVEIEFTTTTTGDTGSTRQDTSSPTTEAPPSTSPSSSGESEPPPAPPIAGDTITGSACPCMVTGITELRGDITLQGDLMVDGGTLVARPGVSVNGNGFQIMFMNGGNADFQGTKVFTWSGDGSNANLTRDIEFRNMRRIMFHSGAGRSTLKYFSVVESGTPSLGDYPVHFHLNGNSVRGTIVEGVVVLNGKNHAFVPHGSHGITFKDTIAKNIIKEAYWWDPPGTNGGQTVDNSNDIVYDHALAIGVDWPRSVGNCCGGHHKVSAFLLGAGSGNVIRNSGARETRGGADCSGFHWPEHANQNPGGNVWTFSNNATYSSNCHGIFVWQNDGNHHVVTGFSGSAVDHGAYVNRYDYRNIEVGSFRVHALGWKISNSDIGKVTVLRHSLIGDPVEFNDVSIDSFTINNAANGGSVPGTYILNGSSLSCQDIVYQSVVPGTQVIIDGQSC